MSRLSNRVRIYAQDASQNRCVRFYLSIARRFYHTNVSQTVDIIRNSLRDSF